MATIQEEFLESISVVDFISTDEFKRQTIIELVSIDEFLSSSKEGPIFITDSIVLKDSLQRLLTLSRQDSVVTDDSLIHVQRLLPTIIDVLNTTDIPNISINTKIILTQALEIASQLDIRTSIVTSDSYTTDDSLERIVVAVTETIETLVALDDITNYVVAINHCSDTFTGTDSNSNQVTFNTIISEEIFTFGSIVIENEHYTFTINSHTKGVSEYTNYNFNSMSDGLGATNNGIYNLTGSNDNAVNIDALIKTGIDQFGTNQQKQVPYAYIGLNKSGQMVLKTIVGYKGDRKERWYTLTPRVIDATTNVRVKMGKGVKSRYWQFELINKEGSTFELNSIKLMPLTLKRRV